MRIPKSLKKGDTIGLISASSPISPDNLPAAIKAVENLGFKVVVGETCRVQHGYLAGNDELRAHEVNEMFGNPNINGIFCIRGGYGASRILPLLDLNLIKANPKVFAGYSDVTALHIVINQFCDFVTFHSPMPSTEFIRSGMDEYTWSSFTSQILGTERNDFLLENAKGYEMTTLVPGEATGRLVGGNLTLVTSSLGTPYEIDTKGKILFLEDIDEYERSIDRMMIQLKLSGKLDDAAGILLGAWKNCGPQISKKPEQSLRLLTIFEEILVPTGKPILMDLTCGHCLPTLTLPLGKTITFNAELKTIKVVG